MDLAVFHILDAIRTERKIRIYEWAEAAWGHPRYQSRISELRGLDHRETKRTWTYSKMKALVAGLQDLVGEEPLAREIAGRIKAVENPDDRLVLLVLSLPPGRKKRIERRLIVES